MMATQSYGTPTITIAASKDYKPKNLTKSPNPKAGLTSSTDPTTDKPDNTKIVQPDQTAYASHYDKGMVKPIIVNINIGNLANFDRMTVAANSEERDLMTALEFRIAEAVYQIFAEVTNQAQLAFNA